MMFGITMLRPIRMLMVHPTPRVVVKAVRLGFDVWAVVDPSRYRSGDLRRLGADTTRLLHVDAHDQAALDALVVKVVRRNRIEHVLCRCGRNHGLRRESMMVPGPQSAVQFLGREGCSPLRSSRHSDGSYLVEDALDGPVFVVTTLTFEGMHQVVGVTAVSAEYLVHPAPLTERCEAAIRAVATSVLDLAGYERGPAQTTVILTDRGPRVDAVHTWFGRDELLALLEVCTGLDVETELVRLLIDGPVVKPLVGRCATVQFLRPGLGRVVSVAGLVETSVLPGVREVHFPYAPGDVLTAGDAGFLLVEGATTDEARARASSACNGIRVIVEEI